MGCISFDIRRLQLKSKQVEIVQKSVYIVFKYSYVFISVLLWQSRVYRVHAININYNTHEPKAVLYSVVHKKASEGNSI